MQLLSAEIMGVARAAFAAQGPDGTPVVYLNSDWLDAGASPDDITAALLEEAGHRLDVLMNDEKDSTGDEGEIFSEAVLGIVVSAEKLAQIQTENDHGTINFYSLPISVEFALNSAIAITAVTDDFGSITGTVSNGGVTNDTQLSLSGTNGNLQNTENVVIYDGISPSCTKLGNAT
ncbi:MAG: hypothetical protein ACKOAO_11645 [Oxalobacteraceae bacterium]